MSSRTEAVGWWGLDNGFIRVALVVATGIVTAWVLAAIKNRGANHRPGQGATEGCAKAVDPQREGELAELRKQLDACKSRLETLRAQPDPEGFSLAKVIGAGTEDELGALANILDTKGASAQQLSSRLLSIGTHGFVKAIRSLAESKRLNDPYALVVKKALRRLKKQADGGLSWWHIGASDFGCSLFVIAIIYWNVLLVVELVRGICRPFTRKIGPADDERSIVKRLYRDMESHLSAPDKQDLERAASDAAGGSGRQMGGIVATTGALGLAQASGFGVYQMASTLVGCLSHAVGVTLPFTFYTGMSTTICTIIGPAGWMTLGTWMLAKIVAPDYRRLVPAVVCVACIRARLTAEQGKELSEVQREIDALSARIKAAEQECGS